MKILKKVEKNTKNNKKKDPKGGSVLESNHQEDKTEFITLAIKMIDNDKFFHSLNG